MNVISNQLGQLSFEEDQVIRFENGLLGFEQLTRFLLMDFKEMSPFQWLISIEEPMIAFALLDPSYVVPSYTIKMSKESTDEQLLIHPENNKVYSIVNFADRIPTINLRGPIVINERERYGVQLVLNDEKYSFKHRIDAVSVDMENV